MSASAKQDRAANEAGSQQSGENQSWGFNRQNSLGQSSQGSQSTSGQNVWGAQAGALGDIYGQAQGLMAGSNPYGQQASMLGQAGQNAWQQQLVPGQNPYFDQAVQASIDQATDSFKKGTLADLDARSAGVGQLGSARDRLATGEAAGQFGKSIAQTTAQQYAQQYGADQDRALQAIGMTGNMQQSAYSPLSVAASLIGGPTVLSNAQSGSWGNSLQTSNTDAQQGSTSWTHGDSVTHGRSRSDSASGGLK